MVLTCVLQLLELVLDSLCLCSFFSPAWKAAFRWMALFFFLGPIKFLSNPHPDRWKRRRTCPTAVHLSPAIGSLAKLASRKSHHHCQRFSPCPFTTQHVFPLLCNTVASGPRHCQHSCFLHVLPFCSLQGLSPEALKATLTPISKPLLACLSRNVRRSGSACAAMGFMLNDSHPCWAESYGFVNADTRLERGQARMCSS